MKRIKTKTHKLIKFFREEIWELELEELSKAKARFIKYAKVGIITAKTYAQQKIGPQAVVQDSLITEGCKIYGTVKHSVLSAGVVVEAGAVVEDAVIMEGATIKAGAVIKKSIIAQKVVVEAGAKVGGEGAVAHVGEGLTVGAGAIVKDGAKVYESVKEGEEVC